MDEDGPFVDQSLRSAIQCILSHAALFLFPSHRGLWVEVRSGRWGIRLPRAALVEASGRTKKPPHRPRQSGGGPRPGCDLLRHDGDVDAMSTFVRSVMRRGCAVTGLVSLRNDSCLKLYLRFVAMVQEQSHRQVGG